MTREDIIRMAEEAGLDAMQDTLCSFDGFEAQFTKFAQLVAAHERSRIEEKWHELEAIMRVQLSGLESAHDEARSNFYHGVFGT